MSIFHRLPDLKYFYTRRYMRTRAGYEYHTGLIVQR